MEKRFFSKFASHLSCTALGTVLCMMLAACSNFLSGGDFKEQLESDINRANETPFMVNIILANPMHGQLNVISQSLKKATALKLRLQLQTALHLKNGLVRTQLQSGLRIRKAQLQKLRR